MAKALPIKTKRRYTAAYAASQPLFDVLRNGMERIDLQRANLEIARDTVQRLHVKLPSASITDDVKDSHEKYMDSAVKAWRLATESYAEIFEALADVTAAEPSAGRNEREGHGSFVRMAETARQAYEIAMGWTPSSSGSAVEKDADMEDAGTSDSEQARKRNGVDVSAALGAEDVAVPVDNRPTNAILMSLLKQRPLPEEKSEQAPTGNGAVKHTTPEPAPVTNEQDATKTQKRLQKRQKKREKRAKAQQAKMKDSGADQTIKPEPRQSVTNNPGEESSKLAENVEHISLNAEDRPANLKPEYDDVSAEVAARLNAKEAKKGLSKEKKRKRESRDSLPNGEAKDKMEKPQKKKARSNEGDVVEYMASKEKAKKHERDVEEGANGVTVESRKKRKV